MTLSVGDECPIRTSDECSTGVCGSDFLCHRTPRVGASCASAADDCSAAACNIDGVCAPHAANEGGACDDRDFCTMAETCHAGECKGVLKAGTTVYFKDDFRNGLGGWTSPAGAASPWVVKPALASNIPALGWLAPERDHTASMDQQVLLCERCQIGDFIESPVIDLSAAAGDVWLTLWRAVTSDSTAVTYVAAYDGKAWSYVWSTPIQVPMVEWTWRPITADVTKYKNKDFKLRIGIMKGGPDPPEPRATVYIDDVSVANRPCDPGGKPAGGGPSGG